MHKILFIINRMHGNSLSDKRAFVFLCSQQS